MKKIWFFLKEAWWDDPYEQSATIAFGFLFLLVVFVIGPLILFLSSLK